MGHADSLPATDFFSFQSKPAVFVERMDMEQNCGAVEGPKVVPIQFLPEAYGLKKVW